MLFVNPMISTSYINYFSFHPFCPFSGLGVVYNLNLGTSKLITYWIIYLIGLLLTNTLNLMGIMPDHFGIGVLKIAHDVWGFSGGVCV